MKLCTKCNELKDESCFVKNNKSKDGLSWWCKDCKRKHNEANKDKIIAYRKSKPNYDKEYYQKNKEKIKEYKKVYRQENKEKLKEFYKLYHEKNKLSNNVSGRMCSVLRGNKSETHWEELVNYNIEELKQHLEKQFTSEMNWDNYGEYWELDHIIPQNLFKFTSYEDKDFKICWSLMNLRPLEKIANRRRPKDGSDISEELKQQILNQKV